MKFTAAALIATALALPQASQKLTPLCNTPGQKCEINPAKYLGTWNEIGRSLVIRSTFQRDCNCVQAKYDLVDPKNIKVTNTCVNAKSNAFTTIVGNAQILSSSELKVSFGDNSTGGQIGQFFQNLIPGPNYVVSNVWTDAQGNYKRALVTSPRNRLTPDAFEFIWILSRDEIVPDNEVAEILAYAEASGFNPKGAQWERTPCTAENKAAIPRA